MWFTSYGQNCNGFELKSAVSNTCLDHQTGSIEITIENGYGNYSIQWDDGEISRDRYNLKEGKYNVLVTDVRGCTATGSFQIKSNVGLKSSISVITTVGNSEIVLTIVGNEIPESVTWISGSGVLNVQGTRLKNAATGNYNVIILDKYHCSTILETEVNQ